MSDNSTISQRAAARSPSHNLPEVTVSELSGALKRALEEGFGRVRVRGELSGVKLHSSGHLYFSIKDEGAVLGGVCWRGTVARLGLKPADGMEVVVTGRITAYVGRSQYQIVADAMELAGQGALLKLLEERRQKLLAEGLFAAERKKKLPFLPEVIGVITSPTGAVIRDILHRLNERFPRRVLIWPVAVQGEAAAEQVAKAIAGFNALEPGGAVPRPDVLIVARGGGSLEDLWAFNEEAVVRAAAASAIPLISAVGHETDTTLIDFASDLRAPTPTAAAELAVPVRGELVARTLDVQRRLASRMLRLVAERRTELDGLRRGLGDPRRVIEGPAQRVDHASESLRRCMAAMMERQGARVAHAGAALPHPRHVVSLKRHAFEGVIGRLRPKLFADEIRQHRKDLKSFADALAVSARRARDDAAAQLASVGALLESLSYERVLERGFALVHDGAGHPVTSARKTKPGMEVGIRFRDGEVGAVVAGTPASAPKPAQPAKPSGKKEPPQGSLL